MNKKGFTLVEVLIVIALIGLLFGIGVPGVMKISKNMKERSYKTKVNLIEQAAVLWGQDNKTRLQASDDCGIDGKTYSCYKIAIGDLIEEDFLDSDKDYESEDFKNSCVYVYKKNNRVYSYYKDDCNKSDESIEVYPDFEPEIVPDSEDFEEGKVHILLKNNYDAYNTIYLKSVKAYLSRISSIKRRYKKMIYLDDKIDDEINAESSYIEIIQSHVTDLNNGVIYEDRINLQDIYYVKNSEGVRYNLGDRFNKYKEYETAFLLVDENGETINTNVTDWEIDVTWHERNKDIPDENWIGWIYRYEYVNDILGEIKPVERKVKLIDNEGPQLLSVGKDSFYSGEEIEYICDYTNKKIYFDSSTTDLKWYFFDNYDGLYEEDKDFYNVLSEQLSNNYTTIVGYGIAPFVQKIRLTDSNGINSTYELNLKNDTFKIKYTGLSFYYQDEVFTSDGTSNVFIDNLVTDTGCRIESSYLSGETIRWDSFLNFPPPAGDYNLMVTAECKEGFKLNEQFPITIGIKEKNEPNFVYNYGSGTYNDYGYGMCYMGYGPGCAWDKIAEIELSARQCHDNSECRNMADKQINNIAQQYGLGVTGNNGHATYNNGSYVFDNASLYYDSNGCFMGHC